MILLVSLAGIVLIALLVYVVREAAVFKTTAELMRDKLEAIESAATRQVEERERVIRQKDEELSRQRRDTIQQISAIHEGFGTVKTQIEGLTQLQGKVGELNDLLKPQQLRGELGEVIVRNLLNDKLPKQYEEEYTFSDGKKVEFAIRMNDRLIPVDSKLQLEDYKRLRDADERQRPALRTACFLRLFPLSQRPSPLPGPFDDLAQTGFLLIRQRELARQPLLQRL